MIEIEQSDRYGHITIKASGKLTAEDYESAMPVLEEAIAKAKELRLLVLLEDFQGWEIGALWRDLRFDLRHFNTPGRIAIVGESKLEERGIALSAPFAEAEMKYFYREDLEQAVHWLQPSPGNA